MTNENVIVGENEDDYKAKVKAYLEEVSESVLTLIPLTLHSNGTLFCSTIYIFYFRS